LQHPAGRQLAESFDKQLSVRRGACLADRAEHRQVSLTGAAQLDALPDADHDIGGQRGEELLHDGGLADAGCPGDEHHLALAAHRSGEPLVELGQLPPTAGEVGRTLDGWRLHARCLTRQRADESVPASVGGADEHLAAAVVPDRPPRRFDAGGEGRFADETVAPDVVEQLLLGDDPFPVFHEVGQHVEDLGLDGNRFARPAKLDASEIELEVAKGVNHVLPHAACPGRVEAGRTGRSP
jgi:hypothetical protein